MGNRQSLQAPPIEGDDLPSTLEVDAFDDSPTNNIVNSDEMKQSLEDDLVRVSSDSVSARVSSDSVSARVSSDSTGGAREGQAFSPEQLPSGLELHRRPTETILSARKLHLADAIPKVIVVLPRHPQISNDK